MKYRDLDKNPRQTIGQIFIIPAALAVLTGGGLVFALVEDGVWDVLSWVTLSIPIVLLAICLLRGRGSPSAVPRAGGCAV